MRAIKAATRPVRSCSALRDRAQGAVAFSAPGHGLSASAASMERLSAGGVTFWAGAAPSADVRPDHGTGDGSTHHAAASVRDSGDRVATLALRRAPRQEINVQGDPEIIELLNE